VKGEFTMKKTFITFLLTMGIVACATLTKVDSNAMENSNNDIDYSTEISVDFFDMVGIDSEDLKNVTIQNVEVKVHNTDSTYATLSNERESMDAGLLIAEVENEDTGENELNCVMFMDDDGVPLSAARISSWVATTPERSLGYVKMTGKYKVYSDGLASVYVNPYQLQMISGVSGLSYMTGQLSFHGYQVNTSNWSKIAGTDCSVASKIVNVYNTVNPGTYYSSTGYVYGSSKALCMRACGDHSTYQFYMKYNLNGKEYSSFFNLSDY
jgi:hypothetical protein